MRGVLRSKIDEPLLAYLEKVVFDVEATRQAIADEHARRTVENSTLLQDAEHAVSHSEAALARVRADYVRGALKVEDWETFRDELTEQHQATQHEVERLRFRAEEVSAEAAAFDVDDETAQRLAALREAIAGEVVEAEGLDGVRAMLKRVFAKFTLVRTPEDELLLVPEVAVLDEVEAWVRLPDGRTAVRPLPQTLALPGKQSVRKPS